jgi:hypothetical protein
MRLIYVMAAEEVLWPYRLFGRYKGWFIWSVMPPSYKTKQKIGFNIWFEKALKEDASQKS